MIKRRCRSSIGSHGLIAPKRVAYHALLSSLLRYRQDHVRPDHASAGVVHGVLLAAYWDPSQKLTADRRAVVAAGIAKLLARRSTGVNTISPLCRGAGQKVRIDVER